MFYPYEGYRSVTPLDAFPKHTVRPGDTGTIYLGGKKIRRFLAARSIRCGARALRSAGLRQRLESVGI